MSINIFTSAKSVSKYINQKNPTLDNVTKAEVILKSKIATVLSDIKHYEHVYKDTPLFIGSQKSNDTNYEYEQLLVNKLIEVTSNDTAAKNPDSAKNISRLSKKLAKYRSQDLQLKNCKDIIEHKTSENVENAKNTLIARQQCALNGMTLLSNCAKATPEYYETEGAFRKTGTMSENDKIINKIHQNITKEEISTITEKIKPHNLFSVIKKLFNVACSDSDRAKLVDLSKQYNTTKQVPSITDFPLPLQRLLPLLATVSQHEDKNKMSAMALATCFNFDYFSADNQNLLLENINEKLHLSSESSITALVTALIQDEKLKLSSSDIGSVENNSINQQEYIEVSSTEPQEHIYETIEENSKSTYAEIKGNQNPIYDLPKSPPQPVFVSKPKPQAGPQHNTFQGQGIAPTGKVSQLTAKFEKLTRSNSV
ncbi:TPA: hypothetical protein PXM28_000467 [Yersinia enterocolitica]|nr:hypothetical protein [Yersinia enterocolitica]